MQADGDFEVILTESQLTIQRLTRSLDQKNALINRLSRENQALKESQQNDLLVYSQFRKGQLDRVIQDLEGRIYALTLSGEEE